MPTLTQTDQPCPDCGQKLMQVGIGGKSLLCEHRHSDGLYAHGYRVVSGKLEPEYRVKTCSCGTVYVSDTCQRCGKAEG